jgi:methionine sulfoxide reductase heme-binding subunit
MTSTALWYASRATGVVSLLLLSAVVVIGILINRKGRLPGLPRFAVTGLHRNLSLLAVVFLAVHVLTAVFDQYVSIQLVAAIVPFASHYEPLWIGLGAVSLDLIVALIATSLVRSRLSPRVWRAVHWLAYVSYPVALLHSIGSSTDLRAGALLALTVVCVLAVAGAVAYRLATAVTAVRRWRRVQAQFAGPAPRRAIEPAPMPAAEPVPGGRR